ncbi:MAG: hypothetical protein KJT03_05375, partial [Verrucomicrobiae bacterium]|nr:hypothetical protein [Verrucomicrobiae bacterium]
AHQAFSRFADTLVERKTLPLEERDYLEQILQLGDAHWGKENWAPAFYAFERVLNELTPLIDEGLGQEKATELEARYSDLSQSFSGEIILVESSYLEAIEVANQGYNALLSKDWISAIQSFAKAVDALNLAKAHAAEIVAVKLRDAYDALETGDLEKSSGLFNEVLTVYPERDEALQGIQLIQAEEDSRALQLEVEVAEEETPAEVPAQAAPLPVPQEAPLRWPESANPLVAEADRHFDRREFKESLALYLEAKAKNPKIRGLSERISYTRKVLRKEELTRLMDKASILAELGQWPAVVKTYRHILNVDPVYKNARQGWEEALVNLVKQQQVDQYKELIRHHLNARQFEHAQDILNEARNVLHDCDDFDAQFLTLIGDLEAQRIPVKLKLVSDGETWVCIPGKLPPEKFKEKEMTLFPGKIQILGWKQGYQRTEVKLSSSASEFPETVEVSCDTVVALAPASFSDLSGFDRIKSALEAYNVESLLEDAYSFSAWVRKDSSLDGALNTRSQVEDWERGLFAKLYAALNQQKKKAYEFAQVDARGQFLKVPNGMSRQEVIELGQYLVSLN